MNLQNVEERASRGILAAVRMAVGVLWIANAHWKRPPDFGQAKGNGLARYVNYGIKNPVLAPYKWFLREVVLPHFTAFGWFTLVAEVLLGSLLLIGWRTKLMSLVGLALSLNIAFTVLRTTNPNEWPWSYYMMIALHLVLLATAAGQHAGLDGLRARNTYRRAWLPLGLLALVPGTLGIFLAADHDFTARRLSAPAGTAAAKFTTLVGWAPGELKLFWFNTLGAIVAVVIGLLAIAGWRLRRRELVLAGGGLAALAAVQVLLKWRDGPGGEIAGFLGDNAGTLCLWLALAIGLCVSAIGDSRRRTVPSG